MTEVPQSELPGGEKESKNVRALSDTERAALKECLINCELHEILNPQGNGEKQKPLLERWEIIGTVLIPPGVPKGKHVKRNNFAAITFQRIPKPGETLDETQYTIYTTYKKWMASGLADETKIGPGTEGDGYEGLEPHEAEPTCKITSAQKIRTETSSGEVVWDEEGKNGVIYYDVTTSSDLLRAFNAAEGEQKLAKYRVTNRGKNSVQVDQYKYYLSNGSLKRTVTSRNYDKKGDVVTGGTNYQENYLSNGAWGIDLTYQGERYALNDGRSRQNRQGYMDTSQEDNIKKIAQKILEKKSKNQCQGENSLLAQAMP